MFHSEMSAMLSSGYSEPGRVVQLDVRTTIVDKLLFATVGLAIGLVVGWFVTKDNKDKRL